MAAKQVRLPATVFPWARGIFILPSSFPTRLALPSPKANAKIPIMAQSSLHKRDAAITPRAIVTGPSTILFSSLFLEAISVIRESKGIRIPLSLAISERIYTRTIVIKRIKNGQYASRKNKGTDAEHTWMLLRKSSLRISIRCPLSWMCSHLSIICFLKSPRRTWTLEYLCRWSVHIRSLD